MHPDLIHIGAGVIHSYAVMMSLAFLSFALLTLRLADREGMDADRMSKLAPWVFVSAFAGARAVYVLVNLRAFVDQPLDAFKFWHGGLVGYGGLIAGFLTCYLGLKYWLRVPIWPSTDVATPGLSLSVFFFRIGCFLAGCCYGAPTDLPWSVRFPALGRPSVYRHPTQLYEALFALSLCLIFLRVLRRVRRRDGVIFFAGIGLYAEWRLLAEMLRDDPRGHLVLVFGNGVADHVRWVETSLSRYVESAPGTVCWWISTSQLVSIAVLAISAAFIYSRLRHRRVIDAGEIVSA